MYLIIFYYYVIKFIRVPSLFHLMKAFNNLNFKKLTNIVNIVIINIDYNFEEEKSIVLKIF